MQCKNLRQVVGAKQSFFGRFFSMGVERTGAIATKFLRAAPYNETRVGKHQIKGEGLDAAL